MVNIEKQLENNTNEKHNKMKQKEISTSNVSQASEGNHDNEINGSDHFHNVFQHSICYTLQTTDTDGRMFVPQNSCDAKEKVFETNQKAEKTSVENNPFCYGIKSHIHHFYKPSDGKLPNNGEYSQAEDDFQFAAEPRRRRIDWLVRIALWTGINLMLIGAVSTLVGFLTPQENIIVGQEGGFAIIDRGAVSYNNRLELCQVSGLVSLACGGVIVVCGLITLVCEARHALSSPPAVYCVMLPPGMVPAQGWPLHPIPLYKTVREVQPSVVGSHF